ncbi:MAG: S9 family peptidase [Pyramidobacter sp.]|nr:S9 family peptidase [Pyramidobacter sp.]
MKTSLLFACAAVLALAAVASAAEKAPRIPVEDFFRLPEKAGFQISPDGRHCSWLAPWEGRMNINVAEMGKSEGKRITSSTERDITAYGWIADDRLVYVQDAGGDENYHIYVVSSDGTSVKDMTPFEGVRCGIVDILEEDDDFILISMNKRDKRVFDVYRMNVSTGELTLAAENPGTIVGWGTDNEGKLRIAYEYDGTKTRVLYRPTEQSEWTKIFETDFRDSVSPVGFTADNQRLYIISDIGRDKGALYEYDPKTAQQTLLYENDEASVGGIIWSRLRKKLLGVTYYTDKAQRHYFDKDAEAFYTMLQKQFPGLRAGVSDMSKDEQKMIVSVGSDRVPARVYFYDKSQPDTFTLLADLYPWLKEEHLAEMKPISYTARDGLTIHGYLTLPVGVQPKNLPAIVVVHGGPESRDTWGYDTEAQLLANRGMAVLQVNYRVSTGYGKAFWEAGFKQWGLKQQDDITDGVQWLISQGIADPSRIAIYGGSYGGYAALMGLIKTPELFACGVDYVGVSSLFTLFDSIPPYWEPLRQQMYEKIGNPETDAEQFKATSPVYHADKIKVPLFIAQGSNDPRVVKEQSDAMVDAMRKRGVEVQYMVKENEGHGFRNEENRFDFYRAMEQFLTEHLKLNQ